MFGKEHIKTNAVTLRGPAYCNKRSQRLWEFFLLPGLASVLIIIHYRLPNPRQP